MLGTVVNTGAIIAGSVLGLLLRRKLSVRYSDIVMKAIGLFTIVIGLDLAFKSSRMMLVLISLVIGGLIGELINLEGRLEWLGKKLQEKFSGGNSTLFVQGFVISSLLFCVGPLAIVGSMEDGLMGSHTVLFTKSLMDGTASVALASAMGVGVLFSAGAVLVYQGLLTDAAIIFKGLMPLPYVDLMSAVGGILLLGVALNLILNIKLKVANLLPAIFISPLVLKIALMISK
ncbi:MAG: DUF554 domain-containing protein [Candidatus Edwardsbacteria bacterium]|nr:DUF554 domain-containing protein [Candidatus Edwardsbacteria bacterium]MBU2463897.1 DUF554 domain-containing protein [Candidatus Edwardsbacteria bacterium]MBU2593337.1 DUF554 domain-containing protein [Candidatus Edwardsbacteria bacterium]